MPTRSATAVWEGNLVHGQGQVTSDSGAANTRIIFPVRSENAPGTNPEELRGGPCGVLFHGPSHMLSLGGHVPTRVAPRRR